MTGDEFVERCRALAPILAASAAEGERLRRVPDDVITAAVEADLFRAVMPRSLGGHAIGLSAFCEGTRELANGCPASAWTISFLTLHAWMLSRLPNEAHDDLFGGGKVPLAAAPLAPTGTLVPADGGYRVSGRWEWATGIEHADWCIVHGFDESVPFGTRFAVVPVGDVKVEDVWHTSGMRATGSNTVLVDDVFVPAHHTASGDEIRAPRDPSDDDPLAALPLLPTLALVSSAPAVGAAQAGLAAFHDRLATRVLAYSLGDRAADQPLAQSRLAAVTSDASTMIAGWRSAIATFEQCAADDQVTDVARVEARLAAAAAVRSSRLILGTIGEGAGASVYASTHPIQRLQRDVETLKGHVVFDWDRTTELAGRILLGQELGPADLA